MWLYPNYLTGPHLLDGQGISNFYKTGLRSALANIYTIHKTCCWFFLISRISGPKERHFENLPLYCLCEVYCTHHEACLSPHRPSWVRSESQHRWGLSQEILPPVLAPSSTVPPHCPSLLTPGILSLRMDPVEKATQPQSLGNSGIVLSS